MATLSEEVLTRPLRSADSPRRKWLAGKLQGTQQTTVSGDLGEWFSEMVPMSVELSHRLSP
jgi:hypothetical protein